MNNIKVSKEDIKQLKKHKEYDIQYTDDMINAINLISYKKSQVSPFGSFIFSNLPLAGDIDLREKCDSIEEIPNIMKKIIGKILNNSSYRSIYILGDIKAGRKKELQQLHDNIGFIKDGEIHNFNKDIFILFNNKYKDLGFDIPDEKDSDYINKWLKLYSDLHKAETIRWTPQEIYNGYKSNNLNVISLDKAVYNSDLNKIDMYFFSDTKGKFVEITNVLYENDTPANETQYAIALNGLQYLMLKPQNIMKYLKRYYSYMRQKKDWKFLKVVSEYLQGNINLLNSCATDLSILTDLSEYGYSLMQNKNLIHIHINNILGRLQNIYEVDIGDAVFSDIKKIIDCHKWSDINAIVERVADYIRDIVNKKTLEFIDKNKIPVLII